jgi:hypothetical protein
VSHHGVRCVLFRLSAERRFFCLTGCTIAASSGKTIHIRGHQVTVSPRCSANFLFSQNCSPIAPMRDQWRRNAALEASNFGTFFPAFNKPPELAAGCEKRTAAGGSLPVRLEPRSRRAERGDGDREGRSRPVVPQPHAIRARLSPRELVLTWLIDAPHKRPFRCWTELVLSQQWFASTVFTRAASRLAYAFNDRPAGMAKRIRKFAQA